MCENFRAVIIQRARNYFFNHKNIASITLISIFQNLQKTLSQIALKTDLKKF
ncbi:hypothetical protein HPNQ4076_0606 [Helicobacter pylori NQ4076]|uniref:Uncharacterized protein n=1 Tax=Helicobacter pylori NQ4076 TaxID=992029 RepID=I9ZDN9_HELPX|nr:hypothetical protein HPNQ4076_0606 [Helicobacter pylori NQ4076]